jgi:hypothetical protein
MRQNLLVPPGSPQPVFFIVAQAILSKLEDYVIPDGVFRGFLRPLEYLQCLPSVLSTHPNTLTVAHLIPAT